MGADRQKPNPYWKISVRLLQWYRRHARDLPWRRAADPYAIWVAEIMLQQTRVETVVPYYERWMANLPDVQSLARASEQHVLHLWEGLGYYRRVRNLRHAAQMVVREHGAQVPRTVEGLLELPGIGQYTAGAIASIAFGVRAPTLDGNIRRVLARLFDLPIAVDSPKGQRLLWELAARCLSARYPGDHNQALMDLGSTICRPKAPRCEACPLRDTCVGYQRGTQHLRPVRSGSRHIPTHVHGSAVIARRGSYLLSQRPTDGLLGGLWEFPQVRVHGSPGASLAGLVRSHYGVSVRRRAAFMCVEHAYSHFRVVVHVFRCELISRPSGGRLKWIKAGELESYPMGKVDRIIAARVTGRDSLR